MPHPRMLFLVADGGSARWIARDHENQHFSTERETHARHKPAAGQAGTVVESVGHERHGLGERVDLAVRRREQFAAELAADLEREVKRSRWESLALVAPPRMLQALEKALSGPMRTKVHARLGKDLVKVGDHALGEWLSPLELSASQARRSSTA